MIVVILVMLTGAASALMYALSRQWLDALLALIAAAALSVLLGDHTLPGQTRAHALIDPEGPPADLGDVRSIGVKGDGMRAARWRDLPARPLTWQAPKDATLTLDFPRRIARGSLFRLTATRPGASGWRMQLLAENGLLLAESNGKGATQALAWTPPAAERMVLKARVLDAKGQVIEQGPVPLLVVEPPALRVTGRFSAPSFDLHALHTLLADSGALLDWQVELGSGIIRGQLPRTPFAQADLVVMDGPWLAAHPELAGSGAALLVIGAPPDDAQTVEAGPLALEREGRKAWLAQGDWHRMAIGDPRAHSLWWQEIFDRLDVRQGDGVEWVDTEALPLPHDRLEVCARGASGNALFPQLRQSIAWQARSDRADALCVAVWPAKTGWLEAQSGPATHQVYVYANTDWPSWQAALRRAATAAYAARTPGLAQARARPLPAWPFAAVFGAALLLLWWRERRL
ncbi:MAG: hypothetical protein ACLGI6_07035 [Gammaproteobacteria bacterium]